MDEQAQKIPRSWLGNHLKSNKYYQIGEILLLFVLGLVFIQLIVPLVGENQVYKQLIVWFANIILLCYVWLGLKLRGQKWKDFGLTFKFLSGKEAIKMFLLTLLVFALGIAGFLFGSVVMANITGIPEGADMSGYDYFKDNFWIFAVSLGGVYIASSFGEEVIYRAFLINRISEIGNNTQNATIMAVVLSSILFGLVHYAWGPMGMVQTGFMGLMMGICYVKLKKRLWILVLAHAYMDTILLVQVYMASN